MKFKDFLTIKYGKNQMNVIDENGTIPIYGTGGIFGYARIPLYKAESVLIGRKGSITNPIFVKHPFWTVDTLFYTIINTDIVIPQWFYYKLLTIDLNQYNEGTTVPSLTTKALNEIDIYIPSKKDQQHIVDTIGSVDDLIEKYTSIISTMLELGDLIQSSSEHKSDIVFCSDLNIKYGLSVPSKKRINGKYLLYSSNGITDQVNVTNSKGTSIIFGCRGTVGTSFYSYKDCFVLNTAMYFNAPKSKLGNYFFSIREAKGFINLATGAAQPQITLDNLKKSILRISISNEQNNILEKIDQINEKLAVLKKYKEQLLNKFF